ncbi:MAG: TrkA family potassium uptake protein [Spirochaetaceae bacterium]|nr:MAG: TrkA family potassium uptake protein [Spirochaetaceae bacterium]
MKQFAIIGLSHFGSRVLEELLQYEDVEVLIIDRDQRVIEEFKDVVAAAYIADVIKQELIEKLVPTTIDAAIVDLGDKTEASILVTNYLKKRGIKRIIAKAETEQHGEILSIVGATDVVYPNREAAKRITLPLISSALSSFFPISEGLVIAEVRLPDTFAGKTVIEADLRKKHGINILAVRRHGAAQFDFISPAYQFGSGDTVLVVGREADIATIPAPSDGIVQPPPNVGSEPPSAAGPSADTGKRSIFGRLAQVLGSPNRRSLRKRIR